MGEPLLSDGKKPPRIPDWLVVVLSVPALALLFYGFKLMIFVAAFFYELTRKK